MNKKNSLLNEPGIWPVIHKCARNCFSDASRHINDLPPLGRYALIHISQREETIREGPLSAIRWSLVIDDTSELLTLFPAWFIKAYREMDATCEVAVFIHIIGSERAQLWHAQIMKREV